MLEICAPIWAGAKLNEDMCNDSHCRNTYNHFDVASIDRSCKAPPHETVLQT